MKPSPSIVSVLALLAAAPAQNFLHLPATANPTQELPNYSLPPFAYSNARVQMFFDATEVGASAFVATQLAFRYDGPLPAVGAPGPFSITRLQIRLGTTTAALPGAAFAVNLSAPLTTAFDSAVTYYPDPGFGAPHPWGAPNGSLEFTFPTPVPIAIPPGGWLVVDVAMEGNNFSTFGFAHTLIDAANTTGGPVDGQATAFGLGCSVDGSSPPATIGSSGLRAPGTAHFLLGQNLGANSAVFLVFGLSDTQSPVFGSLPVTLPGSSCSILISPDVLSLAFANATGSLVAGTAANAFAVPADPAYSGVVIFEQLAILAPAAGPFGVALSNAQAVTLGTLTAPGRGTYMVWNSQDAWAAIATDVKATAPAVRLGTL